MKAIAPLILGVALVCGCSQGDPIPRQKAQPAEAGSGAAQPQSSAETVVAPTVNEVSSTLSAAPTAGEPPNPYVPSAEEQQLAPSSSEYSGAANQLQYLTTDLEKANAVGIGHDHRRLFRPCLNEHCAKGFIAGYKNAYVTGPQQSRAICAPPQKTNPFNNAKINGHFFKCRTIGAITGKP